MDALFTHSFLASTLVISLFISLLTHPLGAVVALVLLPISATTVNVPVTLYVQAQDQYGNRNFGYSGAVTLSIVSGTSVIGTGIVTLSSGQGSRSLTSIIAQTATIGLTDTQSTGLNVSSTQNLVFIPGLPFTLNALLLHSHKY